MSAGIRERTRERCLNQLRDAIPEAMALMEGPAGELSLAEYARAMPGGGAALQDGEDMIALAEREAARLFSPAAGAALRRELENRFLVLTANHHGVDFHPEFLQGDLVFALGCRDAVPLFACGGVPCNNLAYPRGLLLPPRRQDTTKPGRFPALAVGDRHAFVSAQLPFQASHVRSALDSLPNAERSAQLSPDEREFAAEMLTAIYLHPSVLRRETFRDQMSAANALLWTRLTSRDLRLPPLASLEFQHLCGILVAGDIQRPGTLVHDLLLEPELTKAIFHTLNGARACWSMGGDIPPGSSFLFWGLDEKGRGIALYPDPECRTLFAPRRPDMRLELESRSLKNALLSRRLLPTLYLSFAAAALARGLSCAGGVFQYAYLPRMAEGTAEALRRCGDDARADRISARCPLGAGFHALRAADSENAAMDHAAGPADILRHGGISVQDWERFGNIRTRDAFSCSLAFQYEDIIPEKERLPGWLEALRHSSSLMLSHQP